MLLDAHVSGMVGDVLEINAPFCWSWETISALRSLLVWTSCHVGLQAQGTITTADTPDLSH